MNESEQTRYQLATIASETMCFLLEAEYQQGELDLDALMRRLKDLSAYSLTHAEIRELDSLSPLEDGRFALRVLPVPGLSQTREFRTCPRGVHVAKSGAKSDRG